MSAQVTTPRHGLSWARAHLPKAAPGVGASGAAALLKRHGSLEKILKANRFPKHAEQLRLFRSIATMDRKAPLPRIGKQKPTFERAAALVQEWDLKQLATRLEMLAD